MNIKIPTITAAAVISLLTSTVYAQHAGGHATQVAGGAATSSSSQQVSGTGTVRSIDAAKRVVNLSHDPIPAIGWPQMTMDFTVGPQVDLSTVKPGQAVEFTLVPAGSNYTIAGIKPKG